MMDLIVRNNIGELIVIVKDIEKEEYYDHDDFADLGEDLWHAVLIEKEKENESSNSQI
jgi:hypothetical protein